MIVKNITKKVDIPHEPNEWMIFRRLSWRQLEHASDVSSETSFMRIRKMGVDMAAALRDSISKDVEKYQQTQSYDRAEVLNAGIVGWSYDVDICPDNIDQLDQATAEWAFNEILSLNSTSEAVVKNA